MKWPKQWVDKAKYGGLNFNSNWMNKISIRISETQIFSFNKIIILFRTIYLDIADSHLLLNKFAKDK